jgi:hypothetical protein
LIQINKGRLHCEQIWCNILSQIVTKLNLEILVESVFSIHIGNDFVERIFSALKLLWTNERNRLVIDMLKAEICTKFNYNLFCSKFQNIILENKKLISAAKTQEKHKFKN